ncbi:MAG TPA: hypothetical protein VLX28_26790 [Thermoanaerobaculia bacterium]|nr:hypothetical protein [Thermoanaerobaculia bacterium]
MAVRYVRANFDRPPTWTLSGAWASADRLMLADPVGNTVLEYQMPSGRMVGTLPKSLAADFGLAKPSQIRATPKGDLMLKWTNDRLVTFSNTFRVKERPVEVVAALDEKAAASSHPRIESLWGWTLAGNDVLGYGDISSDGRQHWESGVFRFPASNPRAFDIQSHSGQDSSRIFYRLDMPFLTGQEDGTGYVLLMKDLLGIYRSEKGKTDLDFVTALPKGLEVSPGLPDFRRKEDLPSVMRAIEQSTMPAGLWAWERHLYLLSRAPAGTKTRWTLFKVEFDPHTGAAQFIGVELPTHAHHLTVVPGSRWWALVEKGPVLAFGAQAIDSVVLIPSEALRGSLHVKFVTE